MTKTASAIIVSHNSNDFLHLCIGTLQKAGENIDLEIIVFDNASDVPPSKILAERFPEVQFIDSPENLGFGTACNRAAATAKNEYFFFVNPDTMVSDDTISIMLDHCVNHPEQGIVGCRILNSDGTLQTACRRSFPTPMTALFHTLGLDLLFPNSRVFGEYNLTYLDHHEGAELGAVSGSFFCIHKDKFWEVKGFDEEFFLYGEDLDLCYRVHKAGHRNYYYPATDVVHFKGHSANQKPWFTFYHFYLAMYVFAKKHKELSVAPFPLVCFGILITTLLAASLRVVGDFKKFLFENLLFGGSALLVGIPFLPPSTGGGQWLLPTYVVVFLSLILQGRYRKGNTNEGRGLLLSILLGFGAILLAVMAFKVEASLLVSGLVLGAFGLVSFISQIFRGLIKKVEKSLFLYSPGDEPLWNNVQKVWWRGDLMGVVCNEGALPQRIQPWEIADIDSLEEVLQTAGIRQIILNPHTFFSAHKVIFSENFKDIREKSTFIFPTSDPQDYVTLKMSLIQ